jgi:hypothetical protein
MAKPHSETVVVLVDPHGPYLPVLADRTSQPVDFQQEKIFETCRRLKEMYKSVEVQSGDLSIYFHSLPPVNAVFISEECAVLTAYTTSRPRIPVPLLVATSAVPVGYYSFATSDIANFLKDDATQCVFSAQRGVVAADAILNADDAGMRIQSKRMGVGQV